MKTKKKFDDLRYSAYSSVDAGYTVYSVYGEDHNCDMGGSHSNPFLGNVEGTFKDVLEYAANEMSGFYTWGGGGYIKPYASVSGNSAPIVLNSARKLKLERKAKLRRIACEDIDYMIENINSMSIDSIKNQLIELKNRLGQTNGNE